MVFTISPALGFGEIRFGATCAEARHHFGEPSRIIAPPDEPGRQIWVFNDLGLAAGFDASGSLDTFEVFNPVATLHGHQIIGLNVAEAAVLLRREFSFPIEALMQENGVVEQLRIRDLGFGVWVKNEVVTSVSWSDATSMEDQSEPQASPN